MLADEIVQLTRERMAELVRARIEAERGSFDGTERRGTPRWPFPGTVELRPIDERDNRQWFGTCRDISDGGMGFKSDRYFAPGTPLQISIHLPEASFYGKATVRYCMEARSEFVIGVQFDFED